MTPPNQCGPNKKPLAQKNQGFQVFMNQQNQWLRSISNRLIRRRHHQTREQASAVDPQARLLADIQ